MAHKIPIITTTISSSMSVNPFFVLSMTVSLPERARTQANPQLLDAAIVC